MSEKNDKDVENWGLLIEGFSIILQYD